VLPLAPGGPQGRPLRGRRTGRRPCSPPASRSPGLEEMSTRRTEGPSALAIPIEARNAAPCPTTPNCKTSGRESTAPPSGTNGWLETRPAREHPPRPKYRRGEGEILIINHDGRGWWHPTSQAKGDVFDLVQHFNPGLNFGQMRQELRHLVGIAPSFPATLRNRKGRGMTGPSASAGRPSRPCARAHRPGAISPTNAAIRPNSWPQPRGSTLSARAIAAAPGLRIGGGVSSATSKRVVLTGRARWPEGPRHFSRSELMARRRGGRLSSRRRSTRSALWESNRL
jgi:hypothetical protein